MPTTFSRKDAETQRACFAKNSVSLRLGVSLPFHTTTVRR